jgi:M6 family metalloprotease-like protein
MRLRAKLMLAMAAHLLAGCQSVVGIFATATPTASATPLPTNTPTPTLTPTPSPTPPPSDACQLPEAAQHGGIGLGYEGYERSLQSTGTVKAIIIFADFSDEPAIYEPEFIYDTYLDGASEFFDAVSYGRLNFEMDTHFQWFRMPNPSTSYEIVSFYGHRALMEDAIKLADPFVDFAEYQQVIVILNPSAAAIAWGPTFVPAGEYDGIVVDDGIVMNGISSGFDLLHWGYKWVVHETGHSMGLVDLYWGAWDGVEYPELFRYTGNFSVMSNVSATSPEFLAYERWVLGWLDNNQVYCLESPEQTVMLSPIEVEGGIKAVMVPVSETKLVVVESRRALGYDELMAEPGALVYTVDSSVYTGQGPIVVLPADESDPYRYTSTLLQGDSVTVDGVTITVLEASADGELVRVSVGE